VAGPANSRHDTTTHHDEHDGDADGRDVFQTLIVVAVAIGGPVVSAWAGVSGTPGTVAWRSRWMKSGRGGYDSAIMKGLLVAAFARWWFDGVVKAQLFRAPNAPGREWPVTTIFRVKGRGRSRNMFWAIPGRRAGGPCEHQNLTKLPGCAPLRQRARGGNAPANGNFPGNHGTTVEFLTLQSETT